MLSLQQEHHIISAYLWLLACCVFLGPFLPGPLIMLCVAVLLVVFTLAMRNGKPKHWMLPFVALFMGIIAFIVCGFLIVVVFNVLWHTELASFFWIPLAGLPALGITWRIIIGGFESDIAKEHAASPKPPSKMPAATAQAAVAPVPAESARLHLDDPAVKEWNTWVAEHVHAPRSSVYATLAAAVRALERGKPNAEVQSAALQMARLWAVPPTVKLLSISDSSVVLTEEPWLSLHTETLSQSLAAHADFLRALELGKTKAEAGEAARRTALRWAPPNANDQSKPVGPQNGGERRGVVYGLMRRTEKFTLGLSPLSGRRGGSYRTMDKYVWTFALQRQGIGGNGRPLSPIQFRIEGAVIEGKLEDGDLVELGETPVPSEVNTLTHFQNLSNGITVTSSPIESSAEYQSYRRQRIIVPLVGFSLFAVFALLLWNSFQNKSAQMHNQLQQFNPPIVVPQDVKPPSMFGPFPAPSEPHKLR